MTDLNQPACTAGAARAAAPRPRAVVAVDARHRDAGVLEWGHALARTIGAEVHVVTLHDPVVRDFVVVGGRQVARGEAALSPARTLWAACTGASVVVVDESWAHLVLSVDPEAGYGRPSLPAGCAVVVVPRPSPAA